MKITAQRSSRRSRRSTPGSGGRWRSWGRRPPRSEGGMTRLETLMELKFIDSSCSSCSSHGDRTRNPLLSNSSRRCLDQQHPPPLLQGLITIIHIHISYIAINAIITIVIIVTVTVIIIIVTVITILLLLLLSLLLVLLSLSFRPAGGAARRRLRPGAASWRCAAACRTPGRHHLILIH